MSTFKMPFITQNDIVGTSERKVQEYEKVSQSIQMKQTTLAEMQAAALTNN